MIKFTKFNNFEKLSDTLSIQVIGLLITNLVSKLSNLKLKIENGGDVSVNRKCFGNCYETWYTGIFGIADCDSDISITKLFSLSA